jgi:hypothetical protein
MAGGGFKYDGRVWYAFILLDLVKEPFYILRYDQALHFFFYFVAALFAYPIMKTYFRSSKKLPLIIFSILAVTGIGSLNESIEFSAYVFYERTGVGTFINNSLDLIFNFIGAIVGTLYASKK